MRVLLLVFLLLLTVAGFSQLHTSVTPAFTFSVPVGKIGNNVAGLGAAVQGRFSKSQSSLKLSVEAGIDHFVGDKLCYILPSGACAVNNPQLIRLMAGPEHYFYNKVSIAFMLGMFRTTTVEDQLTETGFRPSLNMHLGKTNRFAVNLAFTNTIASGIRYLSVGAGYTVGKK